jgi:hypothetical protein
MKIYILPINERFKPYSQSWNYPHHNKAFGVEQDFLSFLNKNAEITVQSPRSADWHYLPIYWTRWHLNHDYAKTGLDELQQATSQIILDDKKTFTICQYDDGPLVDLGLATIFLASRKTSSGIDIPLLCSPHRVPFFKPSKKYLASFIGRLSTYSIRQQMAEVIKNRNDIFLFDGDKGSQFYLKKMLQSQVALCPRGYGGSSFRFFEAMQLGITPILIGDIDTRPFKKYIDWDKISFYLSSTNGLNDMLDSFDENIARQMGIKAADIWHQELTYQRWCKYVLKELEALQ